MVDANLEVLLESSGIPIINPASVAHDEILIENEHFGRGRCLEGLNGDKFVIFVNREAQRVLSRLFSNSRGVLIVAGAQAEECDLFVLVCPAELGQRRRVSRGVGAIETEDHHDDGFIGLQIIKGCGLASDATEGDIGNFRPQFCRRRRIVGRSGA